MVFSSWWAQSFCLKGFGSWLSSLGVSSDIRHSKCSQLFANPATYFPESQPHITIFFPKKGVRLSQERQTVFRHKTITTNECLISL